VSETLNIRALSMACDRIIEEMNRRGEAIVNGSAETFEEYRERVGVIKGLELARQMCLGVSEDLRKGK
jgi:hypothetical protein